jgi:hypothetical protein
MNDRANGSKQKTQGQADAPLYFVTGRMIKSSRVAGELFLTKKPYSWYLRHSLSAQGKIPKPGDVVFAFCTPKGGRKGFHPVLVTQVERQEMAYDRFKEILKVAPGMTPNRAVMALSPINPIAPGQGEADRLTTSLKNPYSVLVQTGHEIEKEQFGRKANPSAKGRPTTSGKAVR